MSFEKIQWNTPSGAERAEPGRHVVVVGGGIAGLAAATILVERGVRVTLLEKETFLGGRAGSWTEQMEDGTAFEMERGFHAFFRQYYNLRNLLKRVDPELSCLEPTADYPLYGPNGAKESFANLPQRAPWNLVKLVLRSKSLGILDLFKVNGPEANAMLAYHPEATYEKYDDMSAGAYLDSLKFPEKARRMLFDVFAHSFFNPEGKFSAGELIMMFHYYFLGNPEGIVFDVANKPFGRALWDPLGDYVAERGGEIRRETAAQSILRDGDGWRVRTRAADGTEGEVAGDGVVLAVTVPALKRLLETSPDLDAPAWRRDVDALSVTRPFTVWRLWLDRKVNADRSSFVGTTGLGIMDNISIYEQLEDESRAWSERTGGSVVELHAYSVPESMTEAEIRQDMLTHLHEVYPETKGAQILEERFLHRQDCPAFPPGGHARRPGVRTPLPGVTLAGDFVRMPFPTALMERATASGFMAANVLLEPWGVRPEALYSIPTTGMFAKKGGTPTVQPSGEAVPSA